jgi:hypothetical protein
MKPVLRCKKEKKKNSEKSLQVCTLLRAKNRPFVLKKYFIVNAESHSERGAIPCAVIYFCFCVCHDLRIYALNYFQITVQILFFHLRI